MPTPRRHRPVVALSVRTTCTYCGRAAQDRDHYRPWSVHQDPHWVPACGWCNGHLSDRDFKFFGDRAAHIRDTLQLEFRRSIKTNWAAILEGTKGRLRLHLLDEQRCQSQAQDRIDWADIVATTFAEVTCEELAEYETDGSPLSNLLEALS